MSNLKKTFEEFKSRFENGEFDEQFKEVESPEDVVTMARKLGYDINLEDILGAELDESQLDKVAGGKGNRTTSNNVSYNYNVSGSNCEQIVL